MSYEILELLLYVNCKTYIGMSNSNLGPLITEWIGNPEEGCGTAENTRETMSWAKIHATVQNTFYIYVLKKKRANDQYFLKSLY